MDLVDNNIEKYVESLSDSETPLLKEISEYTNKYIHQPRMLSGHLQGRVLSFISKIISPKNILEIGTYTGYSALCLAEGIQEDGVLVTIDKDKELFEKVNSFFKKSNLEKNIIQKLGIALDVIPTLDLKYDLVFIDADKKNYINYFDMVLSFSKCWRDYNC
jgi:predicted O-methyltransferase YrrM